MWKSRTDATLQTREQDWRGLTGMPICPLLNTIPTRKTRVGAPGVPPADYSVTAGITAQPFHAFFSNDGNHDEAGHRIRPPEIKQRI